MAVLDMHFQLVLPVAPFIVTSLNRAVADSHVWLMLLCVADSHVWLMLLCVALEVRATGESLVAYGADGARTANAVIVRGRG